MRRQNLFSNTLLAALFVVALCAASGFAQSQPEPVFHVVHIRVKPEAIREFEALVKTEVLPAFRKSGGKEMQAWATTNFGEAFEYWFVRSVNGIRDFDEPHYLVKALGEKGAEDLRAKIRRMSVSQENFMLTRKSELAWMPNPGYQPKLGVLSRIKVAPGRAADYEKYVKENTTPVVSKTNAKAYRLSKVGLGGDANQYLSLLLFDSYAEIEKFPALIGKARAEANLATVPAGLVTESITAALRYLPELSVTPAPQQAAK